MEQFKKGDWVVFDVSKGTKTLAWDREMVLQVGDMFHDRLRFGYQTLKRYTHFEWSTGENASSNDIKAFRLALPHEIPEEFRETNIYIIY